MLDSPQLDRAYAALSDATRRRMLDRLAEGPASVSELARPLVMSLAAVVQHVQVLEASGLITTSKTGRTRTCVLEPDALRATEQWIADRRAAWERRLDGLGAVLDAQVEEQRTPDTGPPLSTPPDTAPPPARHRGATP